MTLHTGANATSRRLRHSTALARVHPAVHVLPKGFHRIRHYGLFGNGDRAANIARALKLLGVAPRTIEPEEDKAATPDKPCVLPCPRCGDRMIIIEVFSRGCVSILDHSRKTVL